MQTFFIVLILAFGFLITFQIAKASEYVSVLRGEEKARKQTNRINAFLLLIFLVAGLIGVYYCNERLKGKILGESASVQGDKIDTMLYITLAITGIVFFITQKLIFGSKDVIHDVGLAQFRMKMDAVPGTPTTMWFTPKYTTRQMIEKTGDPDFVYEISCDQLCGKGHYAMRGVLIVETQEEFDRWIISQKPQYVAAHPELTPQKTQAADTTKRAADTTKVAVANLKK